MSQGDMRWEPLLDEINPQTCRKFVEVALSSVCHVGAVCQTCYSHLNFSFQNCDRQSMACGGLFLPCGCDICHCILFLLLGLTRIFHWVKNVWNPSPFMPVIFTDRQTLSCPLQCLLGYLLGRHTRMGCYF